LPLAGVDLDQGALAFRLCYQPSQCQKDHLPQQFGAEAQ
jgi:hypothetical protein